MIEACRLLSTVWPLIGGDCGEIVFSPSVLSLSLLTFASVLDADGLEAPVEGGGVDDVRAEVPVVLPVDKERHGHRDHQAHDDGNDDAHVQCHVVRAGGHWSKRGKVGGREREREIEKEVFSLKFN